LSIVDGPPFPRGWTWSISSIAVAPQMAPSASFHWHFPSSRFTTSLFTLAGTEALRFCCFSMSASSAAASTCSSVAPGVRCDSPAFAFFSSARNSRETVMWIRLAVAVIGSTRVRSSSLRGMPSSPGRTSGTTIFTCSTLSTGPVCSTRVTTVLVGTTGRGFSSAASSRASCLDRP
jgi:hypothetical protein